MKKRFPVFFLLIILPSLLWSITADEIIQRFDMTLLLPNIQGTFHVKMISHNGDTREIEAKAYQKMIDDNQMNRLFLFDYPPTVRDTGLLVHSFFDQNENNMWIYLPAVRRVKRIALESSGGGYFMGTDFTYRDLIRQSESQYNYDLVDEDTVTINGEECYVIKKWSPDLEARQGMGYSYTLNYYREKDYLLYRIDFYDLSEELLKVYQVHDELVMEGYIYPTHMTMENVQTGHQSIIEVKDINTDDIPDRYFTTRYLQSR